MKIPNLLFYGTIKEGQLHIFNKKLLVEAVRKSENTQIVLEIKQDKKKRSLHQNDYYWGVVLATISLETGQPADDIHKFNKENFCPKKTLIFKSNVTGKEECITIYKDSKELNTSEFTEFLERVRAFWGSEYGIEIPDPVKGYDTKTGEDYLNEMYKNDDYDPSLCKL